MHEATCLPSEFLGVTIWKCENAIVKVCHLTSAYFKSLLVKMFFLPPSSSVNSARNLTMKWHLAVF